MEIDRECLHAVAKKLHEKYHPTLVFVSPTEIAMLHMHGGCPFMPYKERLSAHVACTVTRTLMFYHDMVGRILAENLTASVAAFTLPSDNLNCRCREWEAYNYMVARRIQANTSAINMLASIWLPDEYSSGARMPLRSLKSKLLQECTKPDRPLHAQSAVSFCDMQRWMRYGMVFRHGKELTELPSHWWKCSTWRTPNWMEALSIPKAVDTRPQATTPADCNQADIDVASDEVGNDCNASTECNQADIDDIDVASTACDTQACVDDASDVMFQ